jgi:hypothetical protein
MYSSLVLLRRRRFLRCFFKRVVQGIVIGAELATKGLVLILAFLGHRRRILLQQVDVLVQLQVLLPLGKFGCDVAGRDLVWVRRGKKVIEPLSRCLPPPHLRNKRLHLLEVLHKARETFERADSTFKAKLADEKNNLQLLEVFPNHPEGHREMPVESRVISVLNPFVVSMDSSNVPEPVADTVYGDAYGQLWRYAGLSIFGDFYFVEARTPFPHHQWISKEKWKQNPMQELSPRDRPRPPVRDKTTPPR